MAEWRFKLVFDKLEQLLPPESTDPVVDDYRNLMQETDEIAELKRFAAEASAPELQSYTTT